MFSTVLIYELIESPNVYYRVIVFAEVYMYSPSYCDDIRCTVCYFFIIQLIQCIHNSLEML